MSRSSLPRLPPAVRAGDRVGVAALSSPVDPARLEAGLLALRRLGFEPVEADNLRRRHGLFAGSDEERLAAFHALAADPSLTAILFARGGHGALRLLPRLDWRLLRRVPRAYVGYSDLTPFLLEVGRRLDLVTFHGPMVAVELASGLDAEEEGSLLAALGGGPFSSRRLERVVRAGEAVAGELRGGCLSLLAATLGTPFAPRLDGAVLFWEEVDEPLYRLDRMLTHLRLSGNLARIRGMVIGCMRLDRELEEAWVDSLLDLCAGTSWPIAAGLESGHHRPNLTLPLGVRARIDCERCVLALGEEPGG